MKSDHRHELKTNALAEWIANFPQWARENRTSIITILVVVVAAAVLYFWLLYGREEKAAGEQLELTRLINQLQQNKIQVLSAGSQGRDVSFILLQPAGNLKTFAGRTKNPDMAAMASIKHAEALRMELHYRLGAVTRQESATQINQAKASYAAALERASSNPTLAANATLGIGLCEEELGNFEKAQQIYRDLADNPDFKATTARASAMHRLNTMADFRKTITFRPRPKPGSSSASSQAAAVGPRIEIKPVDPNLQSGTSSEPAVTPLLVDVNNISQPKLDLPTTSPPALDVNQPKPAAPTAVPDANTRPEAPKTMPETTNADRSGR